MPTELEKIRSKYDEALLLPENEQNDALTEIRAELEKIAEEERNDDYFHLKGLSFYMMRLPVVTDAQECFQQALEINPAHNGARLYLGHCLYDTGFYKDAEHQFSLVDGEEFNEWMRMKIEEMLVCCRVKISDLDEESLVAARAIVKKYEKSDFFDDYLFNLAQALKEFGMKLDDLFVKPLKFRRATIDDLPEIVRMLADDFLGSERERYEIPLPESYTKAFEEIEADKNNELIVAVLTEPPGPADFKFQILNSKFQIPNPKSEIIVGSLQLTFTPSISFQGGKRATVESVRIDEKYRGRGIGHELMKWAINRAKEENCITMQLTTNSERTDAHRFYENLGFKGSHLGMKLYLK